MGMEALTHSDDGTVDLPKSDADWGDWVSATETRNYVLADPLLDWLDLYGSDFRFQRDDQLPGYDLRTDYTKFILDKGMLFETAIVNLLRPNYDVLTIATSPHDVRDLNKAKETCAAMEAGAPIIHQGVLRDPEQLTYGIPDLLVRSDVLLQLFPGSIDSEEATASASALSGFGYHYRVIGIKYRNLGLLVNGSLYNGGSVPSYKLQLFIYNCALGRVQGFEPPIAYILGRGWIKVSDRGSNCLERLGPVPMGGTIGRNRPLISEAAGQSLEWIRRVRRDGRTWVVLPKPTVPEIRPNMRNGSDYPWHSAKTGIALELADPTMLWQVGVGGPESAMEFGVGRWSDPAFTAAVARVTRTTNAPKLDAVLDVNRLIDGPPVRPSKVSSGEAEWRGEPLLEFYVDFETVSDLDDDFANLPEKGGQPLIFMGRLWSPRKRRLALVLLHCRCHDGAGRGPHHRHLVRTHGRGTPTARPARRSAQRVSLVPRRDLHSGNGVYPSDTTPSRQELDESAMVRTAESSCEE